MSRRGEWLRAIVCGETLVLACAAPQAWSAKGSEFAALVFVTLVFTTPCVVWALLIWDYLPSCVYDAGPPRR